MEQIEDYVGTRRSYDGNACTVRYVGEVQGTSGTWLGVEWDDPRRGKHTGEYNGVRYFQCLYVLSYSIPLRARIKYLKSHKFF